MKKLTLFIVIITCAVNAYSQQRKSLKEASFFFENKAYFEAIEAYKLGLKTNPKNIGGRYEFALSFLHVRDHANAQSEFQKLISLIENNKELTEEYALAWYYNGLTLKTLEKYQEAKASFMKFLKIKSYRDGIREYKRLANNEVRSCNFAIEQKAAQYYQNLNVDRLEGKSNSAYSEFSPRYFANDAIIYSSLNSDALLKTEPGNVNKPLIKTYISKLHNDQAIDVKEFEDFNDDFFHTANGSFTPDKKTFYFTHCSEDRQGATRCEIYRSDRVGKNWTKPQKLKAGINLTGYTNTQPYYGAVKYGNRNFDALYFVSDRPGGKGGLDIWFAEVEDGKSFKKPVNCGSGINSPGNEVSPYYNSAEKAIYFSSDYWWGMGGYDVFKSEGYRKSWKRPENLGYPVNSSYDDTYYSFDEKFRKGMLSSNRSDGTFLNGETCCENIFLVTENPVEELIAVVKDADSTDFVLAETRVGYSVKNNPSAEIKWVLQTNEEGTFTFIRDLKNSYLLTLEKPGFKILTTDVDSLIRHKPDTGVFVFYLKRLPKKPQEMQPVQSVEELLAKANRELFNEKIDTKEAKKGDVFILDKLHFEFNKSDVNDEFYSELDILYEFLLSNPEIRIEISGHTDAQGSDDYNLELSQRRAEVVKQYLIEKGIDEERLVATGYGKKLPIADNETEEGRKLNRRTEFKIL